MPLEIYPKSQQNIHNGTVKAIIDHLEDNQDILSLSEAYIFYNFPLFREDGEILYADIALVSPLHGVFLFSAFDGGTEDSIQAQKTAKSIESTYSQIFSKLVKYPKLRQSRNQLVTNLEAFIFTQERAVSLAPFPDLVIVGFGALELKLNSFRTQVALSNQVIDEIISVLDGSKGLIRAPDREISQFLGNSKVSQIANLEEEIRRFDRDQRVGYMTDIYGPQRIRGLAGSGKTVVLAMKAALTHIKEPDANIVFTFYTKSLYQHVKQLITRFYRLYDDRDPDWKKLRVLHAWGGDVVEGFYSYSSKLLGTQALTFSQAQMFSPSQPFDYACKRLLENSNITGIFDYVFVDEAQDFPPSFLRMSLKLAKEEKLVIAYDVLQTIFDVEVPTAEILFGTNEHGEPAVQFDEDVVLHKCYRNPRESLVCAHALGFGIYGPKIIQMLDSKEYWEDFGYKIVSGEFVSGQNIVIERPEINSPSSISRSNTKEELIGAQAFDDFTSEIDDTVMRIVDDIQVQGIPPEDILVICADDKNVKSYFKSLINKLSERNLHCNNLQADGYGLQDFRKEKNITLSTIYKAKGNEAYIVYIVGIDALFHGSSAKSRNMIFTAMTRAKGWLRVSGIGPSATSFCNELIKARRISPSLNFVYPSSEQLRVMKRDLSRADTEIFEDSLAALNGQLSDDDLEQLLAKKLSELRRRKRTRTQKKYS